jgi:hypothetical protein
MSIKRKRHTTQCNLENKKETSKKKKKKERKLVAPYALWEAGVKMERTLRMLPISKGLRH